MFIFEVQIRLKNKKFLLHSFETTMNFCINPLSANFTKWSNTLKQFVGKLSVFDYFVGLALKGLTSASLKMT